MEEEEQEEGDFARATALLTRHGAIDDTVERARHYSAMARDALGLFPASEAKDAFLGVVDFCTHRVH